MLSAVVASFALAMLSTASSETVERAQAASGTQDQAKKTLLQMGAKHRSKSKWGNPMLDPEYFGLFAQGESTYTYDGSLAGRTANPEVDVLDGWNPHQKDPMVAQAARPHFFHESPSGGYLQAWQTNFPTLGASANNNPLRNLFPNIVSTLHDNGMETGSWFLGTGGYWQQNYVNPSVIVPGTNDPSWFDDNVRQIDGFGRQKFPGIGSPRNYVYWEQRSVNTTLTCAETGCTANVSLTAPFDWETEEAAECLMSVYFHPTALMTEPGDFVEWIQVNNEPAQGGCRLSAAGCNSSAQTPLEPCLYNLPLAKLMSAKGDGVLTIAAKIADNSTDQCPYNGNYLSAVPMVTCLVGKKIHNNVALANPVDADQSDMLEKGLEKKAKVAALQGPVIEPVKEGIHRAVPNLIPAMPKRAIEPTHVSKEEMDAFIATLPQSSETEASHGALKTLATKTGEKKDNHVLLGRLRNMMKNGKDNVSP
jgi:hypothetical protein